VDLSGLVLTPGARCSAFGRIVAVGDAMTFEPDLPRRLVTYAPGREPAARPTDLGVPVRGVDLADLLDRREKQGAVEGWAVLEGSWQGDGLRVLAQRAVRPPAQSYPDWTTPPCPEPPAGWPVGDELELPPAYEELRAVGLVVNGTIFHPLGRGPVLVVAATYPARVAAVLGPQMGQRLCVIRSNYRVDEVDSVRRQVADRFHGWKMYASGDGSAGDGQIVLEIHLVRVLPEMARWATEVPDGLLRVIPWLGPNHRLVVAELAR